MISIKRDFVDAVSKQAITELTDDFGGTMVVQTPILTGDHAAHVNSATALMQGNEDNFIAKLKLAPFHYSDEQIHNLRVKK